MSTPRKAIRRGVGSSQPARAAPVSGFDYALSSGQTAITNTTASTPTTIISASNRSTLPPSSPRIRNVQPTTGAVETRCSARAGLGSVLLVKRRDDELVRPRIEHQLQAT